MALPAAVKAAKVAKEAWDRRETVGPLLLVPIIAAGAVITVPSMFLGFAGSTTVVAEQVCIEEQEPTRDRDAVRRAARRRGAEAPAAAVLAALSAKAQQLHPADSRDYAGLYRLPVEYAAGDPTQPGRWSGPTEPTGRAGAQDSRRSVPAATRAVMRKLTRTDKVAWQTLRTAPATTDTDEVNDLTATASGLLTTAFPDVPVTEDELRRAILAAAAVDSGGYGDVVTGGVLTIGNPDTVQQTRTVIGERAFGGRVKVRATNADPAAITSGADRALSAQSGVVIAIADRVPTAAESDDVQDSTNADVVWVVPGASGTNIYPNVDAAVSALSQLSGASAPIALCEQTLLTSELPVDLSAIVAPDAGAFTAIAYAQTMVGRPYSMAARPPATWDCSKLTAAAWKQAGVQLTPYSYTQWDQTQRIPASMVAPGDIAFWFGTDGASGGHVALVDAVEPDGTVWITEAANPTDGVRRRALGGSWDDAYFKGFGRVQRPNTDLQSKVTAAAAAGTLPKGNAS